MALVSWAAAAFPSGEDGRDAAAQVCQTAAFPGDCMSAVDRASYFDSAAVAVCGGLDFPNNVSDCVAAIADKRYSAEETSRCGGLPFDDQKLACLQASGNL